jgi:Putative Flp pilus-assembly TadE/G-like
MRRKTEAGQVLAFTAIGLVALMAFVGLGIDMGVLRYERRLQQTAADAAAIAGANNLSYGGVTAGAQNAASASGFTDNSGNGGTCSSGPPAPPSSATPGWTEVTVCNGPSTGPHAGNANYVEAWVTVVQPTFFMKVVGINSEVIAARAVATNLSGGIGTGCLYTLGTSGNGILLNGTDKLIGSSCGIDDNASLLVNGTGNTITAGTLGYSGSYTNNGSGNSVTPTPQQVPATANPLAYLTPPSTTCTGSSTATITTSKTLAAGDYCGSGGVVINGNSLNVTLNPGVFDGITINGTSNNVTFNPGVYVISGSTGLFVDNGIDTTLTGDGVMFYVANGPITLNGTGQVSNFSAPTSSNSATGAVAGMLFWQAASDTNTVTLNGGNSATFNGIVYAPDAPVTINGSNTATAYSIVVAQSITLNGGSTLNLSANSSGLTSGSPIKTTILVE